MLKRITKLLANSLEICVISFNWSLLRECTKTAQHDISKASKDKSEILLAKLAQSLSSP